MNEKLKATIRERLNFWGTFLVYMAGFALVMFSVDATLNGKWDTIFRNLGIKESAPDRAGSSNKQATYNAPAPKISEETRELVKLVQQGGNTLFLRHTSRDQITREFFDRYAVLTDVKAPAPYEKGRCLTFAGKKEAELLGRLFDYLSFEVSEIIATPSCRAIETAEHAFGRVDFVNTAFLVGENYFTDEHRRQQEEIAMAVLNTPPPEGANRLISAHTGILKKYGFPEAGGPSEGGFHILSYDEGKPVFRGTLSMNQLTQMVTPIEPYMLSYEEYKKLYGETDNSGGNAPAGAN